MKAVAFTIIFSIGWLGANSQVIRDRVLLGGDMEGVESRLQNAFTNKPMLQLKYIDSRLTSNLDSTEYVDFLFQKPIALFRCGKYEEAIRYFEKADSVLNKLDYQVPVPVLDLSDLYTILPSHYSVKYLDFKNSDVTRSPFINSFSLQSLLFYLTLSGDDVFLGNIENYVLTVNGDPRDSATILLESLSERVYPPYKESMKDIPTLPKTLIAIKELNSQVALSHHPEMLELADQVIEANSSLFSVQYARFKKFIFYASMGDTLNADLMISQLDINTIKSPLIRYKLYKILSESNYRKLGQDSLSALSFSSIDAQEELTTMRIIFSSKSPLKPSPRFVLATSTVILLCILGLLVILIIYFLISNSIIRANIKKNQKAFIDAQNEFQILVAKQYEKK